MPANARLAARRASPRLVALAGVAALLLGLVAMHSLGHPGHHSAESSLTGLVHHAHAAPLPDSLPLLSADPADSGEDNLATVMFCLAVLAGAGLAVLLLAALTGRRVWSLPRARPTWVAASPRPPPLLPPSLSELSVLRI